MVNTTTFSSTPSPTVTTLVRVYVVVSVVTVGALAILSQARPAAATTEAWVHAAIVLAFAALLPLRLRSARRGSARARRAVTLIAAALVAVNLVEAFLPGLFPTWMRVEMIGIAGLMACLVAANVRSRG